MHSFQFARHGLAMMICCLWIVVVTNIVYMADERLQTASSLSYVQNLEVASQQLNKVTHKSLQSWLAQQTGVQHVWLLNSNAEVVQYAAHEAGSSQVFAKPMLQHLSTQLQQRSFAFQLQGSQLHLLLPLPEGQRLYVRAELAFIGDQALHIAELMVLTCLFALLVILRLNRSSQQRVQAIERNIQLIREDYDFNLQHEPGALREMSGIVHELNLLLADIQARTQKAKAEQDEMVSKLTQYDALTSLPNRQKLLLELQTLINNNPDKAYTMLQFDIFHFTVINQQLGESKADAILKAIAEEFTDLAPILIGRTGPDDFALICGDELSDQQWQEKITAWMSRFQTETWQQRFACMLSFTVGIAYFPEHAGNILELYKRCEIAALCAKSQGKNTICVYQQALADSYTDMFMLESELHRALKENHFKVVYQPKLDLQQQRVVGAEALLRWEHPSEGLITPDRFIPIAEATGLIIPIGQWVMQQACRDCKRWQNSGFKDISVAVNISQVQFAQGDLLADVRNTLSRTGLDARYLDLELTEGMLINSDNDTMQLLQSLRELGVTLSIDDFGTGYSSLRYISDFPLDTVKIDKSFVLDITENQKNEKITAAIIALAHHLDLKVVAEGVESAAHITLLEQLGCDLGQGFYIAKPISLDKFIEFLSSREQAA